MPLPDPGSGTIALATPEPVALGDEVSFTVDYPGHLKNARVQIHAFQDGELVYGEAGAEDHTFLLGGNVDRGSLWRINGGPAECHADLFYFYIEGTDPPREWHGAGQQVVVFLASTDFNAGG